MSVQRRRSYRDRHVPGVRQHATFRGRTRVSPASCPHGASAGRETVQTLVAATGSGADDHAIWQATGMVEQDVIEPRFGGRFCADR